LFQKFKIANRIQTLRMTFRIARHSDTEIVALAHERHQIAGVTKAVLAFIRRVGARRGIAA
jgi:hypothetical protein